MGNDAYGPATVMAPFEVSVTVPKGTIQQRTAGGFGSSSGSGAPSAISIAGGTVITDPEEIAEILGSLGGDPGAQAMEELQKLREMNQL